MKDESSPVPAPAPLDAVAVFAALGNSMRWQAMQLMAGGKAISATDLATAMQRDFDIASKHLKILRDSGAVGWMSGTDRRLRFYYIPRKYLLATGVVDYGFCTLKFPATPGFGQMAKD